jgi:hypothetical protein
VRRRSSMPLPDRNGEVFEHVRRELARRPTLPLGVLHQLALSIDPSISQDPRAFHARYVAPLKHEAATAQRRRRKSRAEKGSPPTARTKAPHPATAPASRQAPRAVDAPRPASSRAEAPPPPAAPSPRADRDRIRSVLFRFAQDLAAADTRAEIVRVLARIDRYVDQAIQPDAVNQAQGHR